MPELTTQQAFDLALQHHKSRRLVEAENLCRQILVRQPTHIDAMHLLGVIAHQTGRDDLAVDWIGRALALRPDFPEAHTNLGNALRDLGRLDDAIAAHRRAIALRPNFPQAFNNLGNALKFSGQFDAAIAAFRHAISLRPDYADAHSNLGNALKDAGQLDDAILAFGRAIALNPNLPEAHNNLGNALKETGQLDQAIAVFRNATALRPSYAEAHTNLGTALKENQQLDDAIASHRRAIALSPADPGAYNNLGTTLKETGQLDEAIAAFRHAVALKPNFAGALCNLANALIAAGQLDGAISAARQAISQDPNLAEAHMNLANALRDNAQIDEAIAAYRRAIALNPGYAEAHSNLIFALHYHPGYDAAAIARELSQWNRQHAQPLARFIRPHASGRDPDRPLRVGYVSADFRSHAMSRFLLPLFRHHDHGPFRIVCYSDVGNEDETTAALRACADEWNKIAGWADQRVADKIRDDRIDILVDLSSHTAGNRLRVFARKPAPVQATYLAYCSSTGLETIDYRLSDPILDPPGGDSDYTEQTIRLPATYWCYQPIAGSPDVSSLPASAHSAVSFGCLNNFCKISPPLLDLWISLLASTPNSRLILHAPQGRRRQDIADLLHHHGIHPERLRFVGKVPLSDYFNLYSQIDIALDPIPFNGGTTTCDAIWMGVPVVTLRGPTAVGRAGASILTNIGLPELIATTPQKYVEIAASLADDLPRLAELRRTLRDRMRASPLMDAPRFARDIENAYRRMWHAWCNRAFIKT